MLEMIQTRSKYSISLLMSNVGNKKTCAALARVYGNSGDSMLRMLENKAATKDDLIYSVRKFFGKKRLIVIIDDTLIQKMYSLYIEGTCDNFDTSQSRTVRSICSVTAMLTDGKWALPIEQEIWMSRDYSTDLTYKKKTELAQSLITSIAQEFSIRCVVVDGLYVTADMIDWCIRHNIPFEGRFHSNRVITTKTGNCAQVRECPELKLTGTKNCKVIEAYWKSFFLYITALRRFDAKGNPSVVYQVSNQKMSARAHVRLYEYRWNIEMFFRTAKQYLGLSDCQSRKLTLQQNHIKNVFFAYHFLQWERKLRHLKSPEGAFHLLKHKSLDGLIKALSRSGQIFGAI